MAKIQFSLIKKIKIRRPEQSLTTDPHRKERKPLTSRNYKYLNIRHILVILV